MLYMIEYHLGEILILMAAITIMAVVFTVLYILVKRYAKPKQQVPHTEPAPPQNAQRQQEQPVQPQAKQGGTAQAEPHTSDPRVSKSEPEMQTTEPKHEQPAPQMSIDPEALEQVKVFKELLDDGVITQEDYDAKRKELLGI